MTDDQATVVGMLFLLVVVVVLIVSFLIVPIWEKSLDGENHMPRIEEGELRVTSDPLLVFAQFWALFIILPLFGSLGALLFFCSD